MKSDQFFISNEMDFRPPPAKKRKQYAGLLGRLGVNV